MKSFRATLLMAVIAAGLGAFSIYHYKTSDERKNEEARQGRLFPQLQMSEVEKVTFKGNGKEYVVEKVDGAWKLMSPVADRADTMAVEDFIESLLRPTVKQLEINSPDQVKDYGFDDSAVRFEVVTKDKKTHGFLIGSREAYDGSRYIKIENGNDVFIGEKEWTSLTKKVGNDFRLRQILSGRLDDVKKVIIQSKKHGKVVLEKMDGVWTVPANQAVKLDNGSIQQFINSLSNFRVTDFVAESKTPDLLKKYGLHRPDGEIKVGDMEMKYATKDGQLYLVTDSNSTIYQAAPSVGENWSKGLDDFRDKAFMFNFAEESVRALEYKAKPNAKPVALEKVGDSWKSTEELKDQEIHADKVQKVIESLSDLKASQFLKRPLKLTESQLVLKDEKGAPIFSMDWGQKFKENGTEYVPVRTSLLSEVVAVEAKKLESLPFETMVSQKKESKESTDKDAKQEVKQ